MVSVSEVADKVFRLGVHVEAMNAELPVYLIREREGVLIETGPTAVAPQVREGIEQVGMKDLAYIIPTHIHVDHAGGAGTLARLFPDAKVVVHPAGLKHLVDPTRLIDSTKMVWGEDFESRLGPLVPIPESRLLAAEDRGAVTVNGRELQFIYTPGHAPHHMSIYDRKVNGIFCGEAVGMPGRGTEPVPMPAVAPPSFDQKLYLDSMEKLRQLGARILFFSHGGVGLDPDSLISIAEENTRALGAIVLKALKEGRSDREIVRLIDDYIGGRFGTKADETDLMMMVGGYAIYFVSNGLV
jgi:glyoxylase-like metal-dependent hydrolase (beta-lactamase superfamily II)